MYVNCRLNRREDGVRGKRARRYKLSGEEEVRSGEQRWYERGMALRWARSSTVFCSFILIFATVCHGESAPTGITVCSSI